MPYGHGKLRRELEVYATWYKRSRTHEALAGRTPEEVFNDRPAPRPRLETRPRWPCRERTRCSRLNLIIGSVAGRELLPVIELRRAA